MRRPLVLSLALSIAATGCLSNSHIIPRDEIVRLSQVDPERRGDSVYVKQGFQGDDGPPPAPRGEGGVYVGVHTTVSGSPSRPYPRRQRPSNKAAQVKKDSKAWLVIAALAAVGLAATEGTRYIGWVNVHPMHPVHLYGPGGQYTVMPLAHIDPDTAMWTRKAFIRSSEGPTWNRLRRAPLDRTGLGYGVFMGGGEVITSDGFEDSGFFSHIQFSLFPVQHAGLALDIAAGWRTDEAGNFITDNRNALELQVFPFAAGSVHLGAFGQVGIAKRFDDGEGADTSSFLLGGGGMAQLELTTTLAITARAQVTRIYDTESTDFTVGISVY